MKTMNWVGPFFDHLIDLMAILGGILLVLLILLVNVAVGCRYFLNRPIGWTIEVCRYALVCITFLIAAWVLRGEGHVKMDLLLNRLKPRSQAALNSITSSVSTAVCLCLSVFGVRVTWDLFQSGYFTPTILMFPKFVFIAVMAFGCLVLSIQFIRRTSGFIRDWRSQTEGKRGG
ncbi:MAG: TRAP transporter small permease [Deltaproteobacteria bacterium]|nr:TRAP transporter small permease [Deltaproteobacteria bacterium]